MGRALTRRRAIWISELILDAGYSIDIALPSSRVSVEVDGPHHFAQDGTPNGSTQLKRRQLRHLGWAVVNVPYVEWYALRRDSAAEDRYIARLLDEALRERERAPPGPHVPGRHR